MIEFFIETVENYNRKKETHTYDNILLPAVPAVGTKIYMPDCHHFYVTSVTMTAGKSKVYLEAESAYLHALHSDDKEN